ncbi:MULTISPECIES: helicase-related protein [unclassified Brevundimonas]|uniref:helicase-related protein n=1 Tax=unclassified Brevundimonas TaxID=2622653 RepID=UPI0025C71100|nr:MULTISPECIES: helicase-related protein [unclassified Brevundimonas]
MMTLEELKPGARVQGLVGNEIAEVVSVTWFGDQAVDLVFRANGKVDQRVVFRSEEAELEASASGRAFSFDGDGDTLRLASEALRIRLAHLFDPYLAVHASSIEALPHQITAVYGEMLPRQPLRFLLADDPGAGKTIMAGLLIKELIIRGDLERCLIVAPGSLVEQWQDELKEKFGLDFRIVTRDQIEASLTGNPFVDHGRLILRLDMAARSDELKAKFEASPEWDLVICDEAHRMSASYFGNEVKETQRHRLGKLLGSRTRNLLLMSATPHNGKEADFQLFMGLLDGDRFEGKPREGVHKADVSDMMRRLTKEELYRFDGTPLFPERRAYTATFQLSPEEASLYSAVTDYVRNEMNRADRVGDDKRRNNVGFALQILQRRLASSPAAIHKSLQRRLERLETRLGEERLGRTGEARIAVMSMPSLDPDDLDEATGEEVEAAEEAVLDQATAAQTIAELETEIAMLRDLAAQALAVRRSGKDAKWRELDSILDHELMFDPVSQARRKIIIFTEPKDTLEYLAEKVRTRLGSSEAVAVIHGGVAREQRRAAIAAFNDDPAVRVLIANDAAGEGVNLQRGAHLMVNYDLPWNPNRLEQRFGRIHRIGQTQVCHLWSLVAAETREGEVYRRLLDKIEEARAALGGRVYDVLGELFEGRSLKDLLVEAIRDGERPEIKAKLFQAVDNAVDHDAINRLVLERKLSSEGMSPASVAEIRDEMDRAEARRLQPRYVRAFFETAFEKVGGRMARREPGRFEITRVPPVLRERDRQIGRSDPVLERYNRVAFDKPDLAGPPQAALLAPGHPLLDATVDVVLERFGPVLKQGAILVDDQDPGEDLRLLFYLEHAIRDGRSARSGEPRVISQKLQFVLLDEKGGERDGGSAPYLDYRPIDAAELDLLGETLRAPWLTEDLERRANGFAISQIVPRHLEEVRSRRLAEIAKVEREVKVRLTREINYWDGRAHRLREEERAGKDQRLNAQRAERTAETLADRLEKRLAELERERQISALPPVARGGALIVPGGLLKRLGAPAVTHELGEQDWSSDPAARAMIEKLAMDAVIAAELAAGHAPRDISKENRGYDIESRGVDGGLRFIEVKGRIAGARDIILTQNEVRAALNAPAHWWLAVVEVENGFAHQPRFLQNLGLREPSFAETAVVLNLERLKSLIA